MDSITLSWQLLDEDHVALVFDSAAFAAFQMLAQTRGMEPEEMIGEALAGLFGIIRTARHDCSPYN